MDQKTLCKLLTAEKEVESLRNHAESIRQRLVTAVNAAYIELTIGQLASELDEAPIDKTVFVSWETCKETVKFMVDEEIGCPVGIPGPVAFYSADITDCRICDQAHALDPECCGA